MITKAYDNARWYTVHYSNGSAATVDKGSSSDAAEELRMWVRGGGVIEPYVEPAPPARDRREQAYQSAGLDLRKLVLDLYDAVTPALPVNAQTRKARDNQTAINTIRTNIPEDPP